MTKRRVRLRRSAGYGLSMLNYMEQATSYTSKPVNVNATSYVKKLELLITGYPTNAFYRSLRAQMKQRKALSTKQLQAIDIDFDRKQASQQH